MAYVISDDCISCGACESECPVGAISQGVTNVLLVVHVLVFVQLALRKKHNYRLWKKLKRASTCPLCFLCFSNYSCLSFCIDTVWNSNR